MISRVPRPARRLAREAKVRVKASETLHGFLHDVGSAAFFGDLASHEQMLADRVRVEAYAEAIRRNVGPDDVVVDVGTGSGILAILAARRGATVYAIDHAGVIEVAEAVAAHDGVDSIRFERTHSRDFDCPEPVDVLLHEQIGDDVFNERMVGSLLDLKRRVLAPGGRILPARFDLFLEPVALVDDYHVPFVHELSVEGVDFGFLGDDTIAEKYRPDDYAHRRLETAAFDRFLADPRPAISVDLDRIDGRDAFPDRLELSREARVPGRMDGVCVFFRVEFDDAVAFDTAPTSPNTHWGNRLIRTPAREYAAGEEIAYSVDVDDVAVPGTWAVSVESDGSS